MRGMTVTATDGFLATSLAELAHDHEAESERVHMSVGLDGVDEDETSTAEEDGRVACLS